MYLPSLYLSTHSNLNSFVYFIIKTSKVVGTALEVHYNVSTLFRFSFSLRLYDLESPE